MNWCLDKKNRLINLSFIENIRCCGSKNGKYEVRAIKGTEEIILLSDECEQMRHDYFERLITILKAEE